jgi:ABC-type transport system involved in multi-copper enzyme maturation permease subunit
MIFTLIGKEMRYQMSSLRFAVSLVLAFLFLVASTYMLASDSSWSRRLIFTGEKLKDHLYTNLYSWYWVTRDVPALRVLATGLDEDVSLAMNSTVTDGPRRQNNRSLVHNPNRYLFSQLDFVFFINIVDSLLAFAFTFDAVSGERHRGTLRLVMANSIPRPLFLLTKFLGSFLSFLISFLPALIGVVLVLHLHPDVGFRASDWAATSFLFLLALLYLSGFFMLGLLVSCITRNPKTTLTALMMLWVIMVLVIPNFAPFLAVKLRSGRSIYEVQAQADELAGDILQQFRKQAGDFVREHGGDWEALSSEEMEIVEQIGNEYRRSVMNMQVREGAEARYSFIREVETQTRLSQMLSFLFPSATFVFLATDVAHTGIESEQNFLRAVLRYRRQYADHVNRYIDRMGDYQILSRILKADPPDFVYNEIPAVEVIADRLPHFMVLVLYPLLFFLGAQIAFVRSAL